MDATTTTPAAERPHISWETWNYMKQEIARLQAEADQLRGEVSYWEQQTNHWYMKANYSEIEIAAFIRRRSRGQDGHSGEWLPIEQQHAA